MVRTTMTPFDYLLQVVSAMKMQQEQEEAADIATKMVPVQVSADIATKMVPVPRTLKICTMPEHGDRYPPMVCDSNVYAGQHLPRPVSMNTKTFTF